MQSLYSSRIKPNVSMLQLPEPLTSDMLVVILEPSSVWEVYAQMFLDLFAFFFHEEVEFQRTRDRLALVDP